MKQIVMGEKDRIGIGDHCSEWYRCPKCWSGQIATGYKYCPECGSKIHWEKN